MLGFALLPMVVDPWVVGVSIVHEVIASPSGSIAESVIARGLLRFVDKFCGCGCGKRGTLTTCNAIVKMLESIPSQASILTEYEPESVYDGEYLQTVPTRESFTPPEEAN